MKNLIVLLGIVFLTSCSGEFIDSNSISSVDNLNEDDIGVLESQSVSWTTELSVNAYRIGEMHNDLLDVFADHNTTCYVDVNSFKTGLWTVINSNNSSFLTKYGMPENPFETMVSSYDHCPPVLISNAYNGIEDFNNLIDTYVTDQTLNSVSKSFVTLVNQYSGSDNYSAFENAVKEFYNLNISNLTGDNKLILDILIDVSLHSANYWLNTSQGGQNGYSKFYNMWDNSCGLSTSLQPRRWNPFKFVLFDGSAAFLAAATACAATAGAAAIPNPLTLGIPPAGIWGLGAGLAASAGYTIDVCIPD